MSDDFIPLAVPNLTGNEARYLQECIETTYVSSVGPFVERLEADAARVTGAAQAVATSSGTAALHTALVVLGVRPGDLVVAPSFTFIASANAIRHAGADPWLMDVERKSWCLNAEQVAVELAAYCERRGGTVWHRTTGRRVSAIMPVYTLGNTPDMDAICELADEWGLPVLVDAACAVGVTYKGRPLGGLADLSAISLNGNKTVTGGGGGLIVGEDRKLLSEAKHLTTTARVWPDYDFDRVGYNYRLTNLNAAIAVAQLERVDEFVGRKRKVRLFYDRAFAALREGGWETFPVPRWCRSGCWFSGLVAPDECSARRLVEGLNRCGIGARSFWKPVHLQSPYANALRARSLDGTERFWKRVVTLPCSTGITDAELNHVVSITLKLVQCTGDDAL